MINNYYDLFLGYLNKINFYNNFDKSIKSYFTNDDFVITLLTENPVKNYELVLSRKNKIEYYTDNYLIFSNDETPIIETNNPENIKYFLVNSLSELEKEGKYLIDDKIKKFINYILN